MAESAAAAPAKKKSTKKIIIWIVIILLVIVALWYFFIYVPVDMKKVKTLVAQAAARYSDPIEVEQMLLQGVKDIIYDPAALKEAKIYADAANIDIEQVIVDNAISMGKTFNYFQ